MKKVKNNLSGVAVLLIGVLTLSACIKDNSEVVTESFDLEAFTGIELSMAADVVIVEGDVQQVEVTGPSKTVGKIKKTVKNGIWDISLPNGYNRRYDDLQIRITSNNIEEITISGSGDVTASHELPLNYIKISGSGGVQAVTNVSQLESKISGSGSISISGYTNDLNQTISGSGDFRAFGLESRDAYVKISGSGTAEVYATETLNVQISGSGDVYYKGSPDITTNISGSGNIISAN